MAARSFVACAATWRAVSPPSAARCAMSDSLSRRPPFPQRRHPTANAPRPPLQRRFQVGPVRHASPEPPAFRGPLRRFLRASLINGNPRETASRST